ncbi:hypothetical protein BGZ50_005518 [Haplosporangium sp. Z 11]|nr:hypothetical protein BGZ50_005518 [Haplosporangium sp. Z 11]
MKFSFLAAVSAIACAVTADAITYLKAYSAREYLGRCKMAAFPAYNACLKVSNFPPRIMSYSFINGDPYTTNLTLYIYESKNCGGTYRVISTSLGYQESVGTNTAARFRIGSVYLEKSPLGRPHYSEIDVISQRLPVTLAKWKKICPLK